MEEKERDVASRMNLNHVGWRKENATAEGAPDWMRGS